MSWGRLAELYLRAKAAARRGDVTLIQQFYQKRLALAWREYLEDYKLEITPGGYLKGETWDGEAGVDASGRIVPAGEPSVCPLRILTVDCQMDHLWLVARAWAADGSSRLLWDERVLTFTDVAAVQERFGIHPNLVFVDAGHATYDVYRECAAHGWTALMGDKRATFTHKVKGRKAVERFYSPRRKVVLGKGQTCSVFYWSNLNIKDALARLRRNQDPDKGPVWEVPGRHRRRVPGPDGKRAPHQEGRQVAVGAHRHHDRITCGMPSVIQVVAAFMLKLIGRESVPDAEEKTADDS